MGLFEIFAAALAGFYALIPSFGLAIILLTVAVRILLLPLSIKQTKSMREMQRIQPEVKKLQAKHKGDRQKMNEEMMALYKEHGVNPFGGCLPLVLQFPVLIGLFYVIREPLKYLGWTKPEESAAAVIHPSEYVTQSVSGVMETLQGSSFAEALRTIALEVNRFLGVRLDCHSSAALRAEDPSRLGEICGSGVVAALPYLVLVLLMGVTTWYQQKQMQARQDPNSPQAQQMQMFARIMPVMLMFFAFTFPSGVVLYWLTTNVWTIAQQHIMLRVSPPLPVGAAERTGDGRAGTKTTSKPESGKPPKGSPSKPAAEGVGGTGSAVSKPHPSSKKKKRRR